MHPRNPVLTQFLSSLHKAILSKAMVGGEAHRVIDRIMSALSNPEAPANPTAHSVPACALLETAVDNVVGDAAVVEHARALQALAPSLAWWQRSDAGKIGEPFASGHANATLIGPGGLEERDDVWVGVSLLAPEIEYPVHHHPPEEVYMVLSPGQWQQDNGDWHEPGMGGIVHNPPDILHAMRSSSKPLLATWCLLTLAA
ncbi:MAG: dimethylsulfonioproprionate lyase family protein [Granulosicoccus sp.]